MMQTEAKVVDLASWRLRQKMPPTPAENMIADLKARIDAKIQAPEIVEPFSRFWAVYPRRVAKRDALLQWCRMKPSAALIEEIIAGAGRYSEKVKAWDKKYIKHPARWLVAERWTDDDL